MLVMGILKGPEQAHRVRETGEYDHKMQDLMAGTNNVESPGSKALGDLGYVNMGSPKIQFKSWGLPWRHT